ncbi:MAG TPA: DoxX family protein [Sulfurovum sp.]|nr:DoxX family protein [Sulfurovum sp.]
MFKNMMGEVAVLFSYPKHLFILFARLVIAYGFTKPALMKLHDMESTAAWFHNLSIPFPTFSAYFVTGIEVIGIVLLLIGLFTRQVSIFLMFVMLGAILFVHGPHGYSVAENGIEIPLYYFLFLSIFAAFGAGKYSLDHVLFKDDNNE